jgi:hypothetical protein
LIEASNAVVVPNIKFPSHFGTVAELRVAMQRFKQVVLISGEGKNSNLVSLHTMKTYVLLGVEISSTHP